MENLDLGETSDYSDKGSSGNFGKGTTADFTTRDGGVSDSDESTWRSEERYINNIHQMCIIITEAVEDDDGRNNLVIHTKVATQGITTRRKGESVRLGRRVEDDHVSNQSRYRNTRRFAKRRSNGIPVRPTPAQKEATARKK
jgi:hypothetical protein